MFIQIRTHHLNITKPLKDYAEKKMLKLDKFFEKIVEVDVELNISEASKEDQRQNVSVIVKVPGNILRAQESSRDMYAAIDLVFDKLGVQLKKLKDRMKDHKKSGDKRSLHHSAPVKKSKQTATALSSDESIYIAKPIAIEDAESILTDSKQPFLVFRNIETENINVLYKGKKGQLNLIET